MKSLRGHLRLAGPIVMGFAQIDLDCQSLDHGVVTDSSRGVDGPLSLQRKWVVDPWIARNYPKSKVAPLELEFSSPMASDPGCYSRLFSKI